MTQNARWLFKMFTGGLMISMVAIGCQEDPDVSQRTNFQLSGNANAAQEFDNNGNPAGVVSSATGTLSGSYDSLSNIINYTISWQNLTDSINNSTSFHFHGPALPGQNAGVARPIKFSTRARTGSTTATDTLTQAMEADLLAGRWYYNIHTKTYPPGEIRGQVIVQ